MADTENCQRPDHSALGLKQLAEDLMGALASIRSLYEMHTAAHPEDDVRVLALGHSEALILRARRQLYGDDCPLCEGEGEVAKNFGAYGPGVPEIVPCPNCGPHSAEGKA